MAVSRRAGHAAALCRRHLSHGERPGPILRRVVAADGRSGLGRLSAAAHNRPVARSLAHHGAHLACPGADPARRGALGVAASGRHAPPWPCGRRPGPAGLAARRPGAAGAGGRHAAAGARFCADALGQRLHGRVGRERPDQSGVRSHLAPAGAQVHGIARGTGRACVAGRGLAAGRRRGVAGPACAVAAPFRLRRLAAGRRRGRAAAAGEPRRAGCRRAA
ncbi:hypothetical protein LMG26685_00718 [Achromobacter mucicolens]|nr:hypothetical protein LMG26685_00718 [Achromobacter mucicolens]